MRQAVLVLFVLLFFGPFGVGLTQGSRDDRSPAVDNAAASDPQFRQRREVDPEQERMERERQKQGNKDRQAALKRDTDKLLALATELKQYVDKSNEHVLSLDVMRKAEEIEKLARQVKDKMKQ